MARPRHRRARRPGRTLRFAAGSAVLSVGLLLPLTTIPTGLKDLPPPITIMVADRASYVPPGTTFGEMVERFGLHVKDGDLMAVDGSVLERAKYPGALLLDDEPDVPAGQMLAEGDRIGVRNGRNHVEALFRERVPLPPGSPADPQFTLTTSAATIAMTRGAVSNIVVSWDYVPTGAPDTPQSVALTFDDGPWPDSTARVLAILKKYKVTATFFGVGYLAARYPQLIQAEQQAGMTVGDHSFDHPQVPSFARQPAAKVQAEIGQARDAIAAAGVSTRLFRPPGGSYGPFTLDTARSFGMRVVLWSVDPQDWTPGITAKAIVQRVLANVQAGSIVLLHDGGGDRSATIKALPAIIKGIRKLHLSLVALAA